MSDDENTSVVGSFEVTMHRLRWITRERRVSRVGDAATKADIARHNAGADLLEACVAMEMLFERLLEARDLHEEETGRYARRNAEYGPGDWKVEITDPAELQDIERSGRLRAEMVPLIKAIYHYCYSIHEVLSEAGVRLSDRVFAELDRVQAYRSKAIVHHGRRVAETRHGSLSSALSLDQRLIAPLFGAGDEVFDAMRREVEQAYAVAEPYLPDESRGEGNIYERVRAMYEGMATLPGPIRGQAKALIQEMGTHSDHPLVLARLLVDLCHELLVPSSSSQGPRSPE